MQTENKVIIDEKTGKEIYLVEFAESSIKVAQIPTKQKPQKRMKEEKP